MTSHTNTTRSHDGGVRVPVAVPPPERDIDISWQRPNNPPQTAPVTPPNRAVTGTVLKATIYAENSDNPGTYDTLACGSFEVVGVQLQGPPSTLRIETVSVPLNSPIRQSRTRGWEGATLRNIAQDICEHGGFTLVYELPDDPTLDRVDQRQEPSLSFLKNLCKRLGASVKVTGNQLVIFDEIAYEAGAPVFSINGESDPNLISFSFTLDTTNCASSATASYKDPKSGQILQATFTPPSPPASATTLRVNARPEVSGLMPLEFS